LFGKAAAELGRHPFPHPTGNLSQAYTNRWVPNSAPALTVGLREIRLWQLFESQPANHILPSLMLKSNFTLKTECEVLRVEMSADRKRATGVTYVNSAGEEFFQPAEMVILSAYVLQNVRLLLLSGIVRRTIPRAEKAWSERTTHIKRCHRSMCSSMTKSSTPSLAPGHWPR